MRNLLYLFSIVLVTSCSPRYSLISALDPSPDFALAEFSFNGSNKNDWILSRIPDYGDGRPEGCIIQAQIRLSLTESSTSPGKFAGVVENVATKERMKGAIISLKSRKGKVLQTLSTDEKGEFESVIKEDIKRIEVDFIGYRTLTVDLKSVENWR